MMGTDFIASLRTAVGEFLSSLAHLLPRLMSALVIVVFGWLLATTLRGLTRHLALWARLDRLIERSGDGDLLRKAGLGAPHMLLGAAVYWITWVAVLLASLTALDVAGAESLVTEFLRFVPSLVIALAVLVIGSLLSNVAWRVVLLTAVNARLQSARLLAALARMLVLVAGVAMALEQLGVGRGIVHTAFAVLFGALMLAAAIAFGLGGRHVAQRYLEERLLARAEEDDEASHL